MRNFSGAQRFLVSYANDANVPVLYVDANGQITVNSQGAQAIRLNYDKGTGGVIIGNGASGEVASGVRVVHLPDVDKVVGNSARLLRRDFFRTDIEAMVHLPRIN